MARTFAGAQPQDLSAAFAPGQRIPRSSIQRDHGLQTAFDAGYLVPIMTEELLPGDTVDFTCNSFGRLTTQVVPVLHPMYLDTFYFAVPIRLLWSNWEKFHGAQDDPDEVITEFETPEITVPVGGFDQESLWDYMDIPPDVEHERVIAFYHRAYALIWNEFFRDQDLQSKVTVDTGDGPDDPDDYGHSDPGKGLLKRGKRKDYFSAARPWPQKGDAITLPLGTSAPVSGAIGGDGNPIYLSSVNYPAVDKTMTTGTGTPMSISSAFATASGNLIFGSQTGLELTGATADLSAATSATINQLREAFSMQAVLEINARSGTRYVEFLKAHFGVHPPDFRLMRPELIGMDSTQISVNPVATTAAWSIYQPGHLTAYATVAGRSRRMTYTAVEHMVLIGLANVRVDLIYQQGLHRKWSRRDRWDYYLPSLAHLGEQAVLNREIYADGDADPDTGDAGVWGYMPRWDELRFAQSKVTGKLRSAATGTLQVWHLALNFTSRPTLDSTFIEDNPPLDRIVSVTSEPHLRVHFWWQMRAARPLPVHSVPGLVGPL